MIASEKGDAQAIGEAASRPPIRLVAIKTPEQQTLLTLHRVLQALMIERTATANQIHGFLLEFGVGVRVGALAITRLPALLDDPARALAPRPAPVLLRLHRLAAGVWTLNVQRAHRVASQLRAGNVWINAYRVTAPFAPFGGFKHSGIGRENGHEGLAEFQETKTVWVELSGALRDPFKMG